MADLNNPFPGRRRSIVRARTEASQPVPAILLSPEKIPYGEKSSLHLRTEKGRCPRCNRYIGKGVQRHLEFCREVKHGNVW